MTAGTVGLVVVMAFDVRFKDRWFQPILFSLPLWLVLWVRPKLTSQPIRAVTVFAITIALAVLVVMYSVPVAASVTNRPTRLNSPYSRIAAKLKELGIKPATIVADTRLLGGNLRLHFPESFVAVPELRLSQMRKETIGQPTLIAWDATKRPERPAALSQMLKTLGLQELPPPQYIESPLKYMREKTFRLGYIVAQGNRL